MASPSFGHNLNRASLHRTEVGLLERGERTPRIDTAIKLAGAVGVPLDALLDGIAWEPGATRPGAFMLASRVAGPLADRAGEVAEPARTGAAGDGAS